MNARVSTTVRRLPRLQASLPPALTDFWQAREPRERRILAFGSVALLLMAVWWLAFEPALSGRSELRRKLPELRAQLVQLQSLARELPQVGKEAPAVEPATRESVEASLARRGLKAQSVAVTGENVRLQFADVSFSALLNWLQEEAKAQGFSVVESSVVAQAQVDSVNASISLRQQRRD